MSKIIRTQKAQRSAILCNGTGLFGIVRGTAGV